MFLRLIELFFVISVVVFFAMQVFIPWMYEQPLFPFFRKKVELEMKLKELQAEQEEADLEARIAAARGELQKKRKRIRPSVRADR